LLAGLLLLGGCYTPTNKVVVRVELPAELADQAKHLRVQPAIAEIRRELKDGVVALELKREARSVILQLPGACPRRVELALGKTDQPAHFALQPLFDVGPSERVVGLGNAFDVRASPRCAEASDLHTSFAVTGGAPLDQVVLAPDGRHLSATTRLEPPTPARDYGIVPVSARAQRERRSEITFRVELGGGAQLERRLGVSAVARASGLGDVGLSHPVLLGGDGWRLLSKPPQSAAALRRVDKLFELWPDQPGGYELADATGHTLSLHSGRYDQTPLDCGRGDCHVDIANSVHDSPMTQVLASDLGGCHSLTDPTCATACHTTGEPGTRDGGFSHVAAELALPKLPSDYDELPRALRRLGGVGCLACHGPTKISPPSQRFALMKSDVCAVCHDAPPRYGHVQALASSRMGHADSSARVRNEPACARCHTAWGAVGRPAPPHDIEPFGLTCATCHDVHPHGTHARSAGAAAKANAPSYAGLLRDFPLPQTLPNPPVSFQGVSRVCISCHAPSSNTLRPEASAAAIIAGQGGLEPETGAPLTLATPHAAAPKGCLSCHDSGPEGLVLGKTHGFRATQESCARCHSPKSRDPAIAQRARQLLARLDPEHSAGDVGTPWHASYERLMPTPSRTRAVRNVLLVLEDPAADVHAPGYARALLDAAERLAPGAKP
jgi:hypothetical protein